MSTLLSKMFEPESGAGSAVVQPEDTASDGAQSGGTQSSDAASGVDLDLDIELSIHAETSVEYQLGDESGGWSNTTDLDLGISTDTLLAAGGEQANAYESDVN